MNNKFVYISVIFMTLFLFFFLNKQLYSLPLTQTIYTIPEDKIEFFVYEKIYQIEDYYRIDHAGLGFGILENFSFWFHFQYLHNAIIESKKSELGDTFLKLWYYINDYYDDSIHLGFLIDFRIPTGKNAYISPRWRNLSLGNNEIKMGPVFRFDIINLFFCHFNLFYIFRQSNSDNFYGGFYINPIKGQTYSRLFGLNPFYDDTFFSGKRLKNDYITTSLAINTNGIYPVIPYIEIMSSFRLYRGKIEEENIAIECAKIDPVLLVSAGIRCFFVRSTYLGIFAVINPLWQKNYIKTIYGIELSIEF